LPRTPNTACEWCKEPFYAQPSHLQKGMGRFCSWACLKKSGWAEQQRERNLDRDGEKNPNYKHGAKSGKHISGWSIAVKGGRCRSCGARGTELHHAIPRSKAPSKKIKRDLRNGLPLCNSCHRRWHLGHPIRREVFTPEEWEFLSNAVIPGEVTEEWLNKHYPSAASIAELALVVA